MEGWWALAVSRLPTAPWLKKQSFHKAIRYRSPTEWMQSRPRLCLLQHLPPSFRYKWGAKLQAGETVLINGATGVSGKLAVQTAKLLGAGRVVGTGRNVGHLTRIQELGADAVIDLRKPDEEVMDEFQKQAGDGYDVILDFLWGHPTELLIKTLVPREL